MDESAYVKGYAAGRAAGSWYFDGNTTTDTYRAVADGILDGDSAILDTFPTFSFGEWAGESLREILGDEYTDEDADEYLDGWDTGVHDEIESTALKMMGD